MCQSGLGEFDHNTASAFAAAAEPGVIYLKPDKIIKYPFQSRWADDEELDFLPQRVDAVCYLVIFRKANFSGSFFSGQ